MGKVSLGKASLDKANLRKTSLGQASKVVISNFMGRHWAACRSWLMVNSPMVTFHNLVTIRINFHKAAYLQQASLQVYLRIKAINFQLKSL